MFVTVNINERGLSALCQLGRRGPSSAAQVSHAQARPLAGDGLWWHLGSGRIGPSSDNPGLDAYLFRPGSRRNADPLAGLKLGLSYVRRHRSVVVEDHP